MESQSESVVLNQDLIRELLDALKLGVSGLKYLEGVGCALVSGLEEVQRIKLAAKAGANPLDMTHLLEQLAKADKLLSENLRACQIEKFELGRLWVRADNSLLRSSMLVLKDKLQGFLERFYGAGFTVRISRDTPGNSKWAA